MKQILLTASLGFIFITTYGRKSFDVAAARQSACALAATNGRSPLFFMENKGAVSDQVGRARSDIQFSVPASRGLNIFIGAGAIHYQFNKETGQVQSGRMETSAHDAVFEMHRMDVELLGADKNAHMLMFDRQDYFENRFAAGSSAQPATSHACRKIVYQNIYPHIDWVLYTNNGSLKHEFVVRKGGKVSDIRIKYGGASDIKLNASGSLIAATAQGTVTEQVPSSFQQDGKKVKSEFRLNGDILTYDVSSYKGDLTIDPVLEWATYYGGGSNDRANAVAADDSGNVYVAGETNSTASIATIGAYDVTFGGGISDAFIAKFNSQGVRQWATYFGGSGDDFATGVALDQANNVYIAGRTSSTTGISTPGSNQPGYGGGVNDAFLAKFSSGGNIQWATYYGGSLDDDATGVATDVSGNIYITGYTSSSNGISTSGAYQFVYGGGRDVFLAKFTSAGVIVWGTYYGGLNYDSGGGIATDLSGNVFITGSTTCTIGIATPGSYQNTFGGGATDAFLTKFSGAGALLWGTYYGGFFYDYGTGLATDSLGNIFMTGWTESTTGIATPGAFQDTIGGGANDAFVAKFNSAGGIQWATYYGGSGDDFGYGLATDSTGDVYITGQTNSPAGIATAATPQAAFGGGFNDAFIAKFSGGGNLQLGSYFGGGDFETGWGIATQGLRNVYVSGYTGSTSGIATPGAYQVSLGSSPDAFLAKFNTCLMPVSGSITGLDSVCIDSSITLSDVVSGGTWISSNPGKAVITSGVLTGVATGVDTIMYVVVNMCGSAVTSKPVYVTGNCTSGVNDLPAPVHDIMLYPNPAENELVVSSGGRITSIAVLNLFGQVVFKGAYNASKVELNISDFPPAVYFVRINNTEVRKFVKE